MYGESNDIITFDLEWPWKAKIKVTQISKAYISERSWVRSLLLNINRKLYMGSPVTLSHLTLSDPDRSKLRCQIWSKIDTCIVRYCVRVNPDFNWFSLQQWVFDRSLQKIANVIPTAAVKQSAKVLGPLVSSPTPSSRNKLKLRDLDRVDWQVWQTRADFLACRYRYFVWPCSIHRHCKSAGRWRESVNCVSKKALHHPRIKTSENMWDIDKVIGNIW